MCVGAVESERGQVMLAYTVLFLFSAKTLNCCDLMLLLLVLEFIVSMCIRLQVFLSWTILMTV